VYMSHGARMKKARDAMARVRAGIVVPPGWTERTGGSSSALFLCGCTRQVSVSTLSWSVLHSWRTADGERSRYARFSEGQYDAIARRVSEEMASDLDVAVPDAPIGLPSTGRM
jgi:hypothetical protein